MPTTQQIESMKSKQKIVMLTAYDYPTAKLMDDIVDIMLGEIFNDVLHGGFIFDWKKRFWGVVC